MGLFKPDWKSKNEQKAMRTVERANSKTLIRIVMETPHREVCMAAIRRMDDDDKFGVVMGVDYLDKERRILCDTQDSYFYWLHKDNRAEVISQIESHDTLADLARRTRDWSVEELAMNRLIGDPEYTEFIAMSDYTELALRALSLISDDKLLLSVALNSDIDEVRLAALRRMKDSELLADYANTAGRRMDARCIALEQISDERSLYKVAAECINKECRHMAIRRIKDNELLADYANTADMGTDARCLALEQISDLSMLESFLNEKGLKEVACRRLLAEGTLEQRILVLREHYQNLSLDNIQAARSQLESMVEDFLMREHPQNPSLDDIQAARSQFESAIEESLLQKLVLLVKQNDLSKPTNIRRSQYSSSLQLTQPRECRDALLWEALDLFDPKDTREFEIMRTALTSLVFRMKSIGLETLLHESRDWWVKQIVLTELRLRDQVSSLMLADIMQEAACAMMRDEFKACDFLEAFPCAECVDALISQMPQDRWDTKEEREYRAQAANIIKKFYVNAKGSGELLDYLRKQDLSRHNRFHSDDSGGSCRDHSDTPEAMFPEF